MTTITTPEMIQQISVDVVKDFITNKVPLDAGIAKIASELELNPEQVKRVVESCNTVTYLALQKAASDRTFEFPVADYSNVMKHVISYGDKDTSVLEKDFKESTAETKQNKEAEYKPDLQTIQAWTRAEYIRNKAALEKLAVDAEAVVQAIGDVSAELRRDQYSLEKLAEVATEDEFKRLTHLVKPLPEKLEDRIFKEAELTVAKKLIELYKEAKLIASERAHRAKLEKRAILGALAGGLGKSLGGMAGKGIAALGAGSVGMVKNIGKSKIVHPLDIAATAVTSPPPAANIWDNLQGRQRRF